MSDSLAHFLTSFGMLRERGQWRERLTRAMAERGASAEGTLTNAAYLHELGQAQDERQRGNVRAAFDRLSSLLARIQAQPIGTDFGPGSFEHWYILYELGLCLRDGGQLTAAEARFREALTVLEKQLEQEPDERALLNRHAILFGDLGDILMRQGKYAQARDDFEQALKGFRAIQDTRNAAVVLRRLGILARQQGEYAEARTNLLQALEQFEDLGEPAEQAVDWYNLGRVALEAKDLAEAERCLRESLAIRERLGDVAGAARCCNVLANVAKSAGRQTEAEGWLQGALERIERVEPGGISHAYYLGNLAELLATEMQAGRAPKTRLAEARHYAEQTLHIMEQPGVSAELWKTFSILVQIAELEENQEAARTYRQLERERYAAFAGNRYQIDRQHADLIKAIVAAARGDAQAQAAVEAELPELEELGWHTSDAVQRIWQGERDWQVLADKLDREEALLILRVLETLASPPGTTPSQEVKQTPEQLLASLPAAILEAMEQGDETAFRQAFDSLSPEEQQQVVAVLEMLQGQH